MAITGFDHVALTVADVNATCAFYDRLFGAETAIDYTVAGKTLVRQIRVGGAMFSVHQVNNGVTPVAKTPTMGSIDLCMRWGDSIASAVALLQKHNVPITEGPVARNFSDGRPSQSVYFRDLDGNLMELMAAS